ncbi:lysozyme [Aquabacterium sp.]|uniref:lysozyme n=1 Tax=Aquabacterium sp. TaxID=1872578 RepID=UPI003BAFF10E
MPTKQTLPTPTLAWPIAWDAVVLIALSESLQLKAYKCPAGVWTCGWGETDGVKPGDTWTKAYADKRLLESLIEYRYRVLDLCKVTPTETQLGALVSLAYNIGVGALAKSSVLKAHNRGDRQAAARAFGLWNKARVGGKLQALPGLTLRRAKEAALYLTPADAGAAMPQAVAAESALAKSPLVQSGAVTAATGALTLLSSIAEPAKQAQEHLQTVTATATQAHSAATTVANLFGVQPLALVAVALLVAGGVAIYWRFKQRREGYA